METKIRLGQGKRSVADAVAYAITHQARAEILAILNEGARSREELLRLIRAPASKNVAHHLREMLADGSIEIAYVKSVRNAFEYYYRAVEIPFYTDEEIAAMPPEAREAIAGVIFEGVMSEAMAALWAGKMVNDRRVWLSWRWFNVDARGRGEIADDQARHWERVQEIEVESLERCAGSGEQTRSIIVTSLGFERFRFSAPPPIAVPRSGESAPPPVRLGQGKRGIEEALGYALKHRKRVEILGLLNEGVRNRYELAALIGEEPDKIKHHLKELLDEGSIELAYSKRVGNMIQHYYRAIAMSFYSDEEIEALRPVERQAFAGVILQAVMAESLAALWAGKLADDRRVWLSWRWFHVDSQGREDIADEQARHWARVQEIEVESTNRCAKSGEPTKSIIVASLAHVRCRRAPVVTADGEPNESAGTGNVFALER
ncbi:MAG TPA: winged helix-turn-helix domain-containing protein [Solirubrobacterales bacterium]|nr:winged helix-turn-helix domain-containing protein [Solirubrobacterales bacterium]